MKANDFVKKFGLDLAKLDVRAFESGFIKREDIVEHYGFDILDDLKRLVESHELVNEFFNLEALGFDKAIELSKKQIEELEDNETVEFWHRWDDDLSCTVARMKQAIADVESCMEVK